MAIPTQKEIIPVLMEFLSDGKPHAPEEAYEYIAHIFNLSEEEKYARYEKSKNIKYKVLVRFARNIIREWGFLERNRRGVWQLSKKGIEAARSKKYIALVDRIDKVIKEERELGNKENVIISDENKINLWQESIERSLNNINKILEKELLKKIISKSPWFFEKLIIQLFEAMGYGKGEVTKPVGDGGIDGIIYQDTLGINKIFFQAKRFSPERLVGRPAINEFAGSLPSGQAFGVFVTTSSFTENAKKQAKLKNLVLIDGHSLVKYMIRYNIGVQTKELYEIKEIDEDYFKDDE